MQSYIDKLKAEAAAEQARLEKAKPNKRTGDSRIVCDKSLVQQIEELMSSLPPAERQRRWTMAEFVARLSGRYSVRPHPMQVGEALRALGWVQTRDWTAEGAGRRFWYHKN
ncbi:MAG: hypothetical protein OXQ30_16655 [Boseongicola sp.]|nr:hypothetical protein [Boseongicola sp.]